MTKIFLQTPLFYRYLLKYSPPPQKKRILTMLKGVPFMKPKCCGYKKKNKNHLKIDVNSTDLYTWETLQIVSPDFHLRT